MQQPKNITNLHQPHQRRAWGEGFTLIELLVVIAILIILAVIAIPVFGGVRQKAESAQCQGNLRSISTALNAYVADHNGSLIPAMVYAYNRNGGGWYSPDKREGGYWYTVLDPYVNPEIAMSTDPNVYRNDKRDVWPLKTRAQHAKWQLCPGKRPKESGYGDDYKAIGYGWNAGAFGSTTDTANSSFNNGNNPTAIDARMASVQSPATTVIIGDSKDAEDTFQAYQNQYIYESPTAGGVATRPKRHSGGGNFLFLDGHIEWITPEQMEDRVKKPEQIFRKIKS